MRKLTVGLCIAGSCLISGCGGGVGVVETPIVPFTSFDEGQSRANAILSANRPLDITFPTDVPIGGEATYDGVVELELSADAQSGSNGGGQQSTSETVIGNARLTVDFASNTFDGEAGNFLNEEDASIVGDLVISGGEIDPGSEPFGPETILTADVRGDVGFASGTREVDLSAEGLFFGLEADVVRLGLYEQGGDGNSATDNLIVSGEITAERGSIRP